ncbi:hypothetical protein VNI00_007323 [Paramarasmius palmivorus]|uniref:Uncharacterized protein n=1 Tax=Paramarasmius palmivorus TaxID=297713 RepID=A0AAW0D309_9AGAR
MVHDIEHHFSDPRSEHAEYRAGLESSQDIQSSLPSANDVLEDEPCSSQESQSSLFSIDSQDPGSPPSLPPRGLYSHAVGLDFSEIIGRPHGGSIPRNAPTIPGTSFAPPAIESRIYGAEVYDEELADDGYETDVHDEVPTTCRPSVHLTPSLDNFAEELEVALETNPRSSQMTVYEVEELSSSQGSQTQSGVDVDPENDSERCSQSVQTDSTEGNEQSVNGYPDDDSGDMKEFFLPLDRTPPANPRPASPRGTPLYANEESVAYDELVWSQRSSLWSEDGSEEIHSSVYMMTEEDDDDEMGEALPMIRLRS